MKKILIPSVILATFLFVSYLWMSSRLADSELIITFCLRSGAHFIISLLLMIWVKKKYFSNSITFNSAFRTQTIFEISGTVLAAVSVFIFWKYNPEKLATLMQIAIKNGKQSAIDYQGSIPALDYEILYGRVFNPEHQAFRQMGSMLFGIFYSLITAAILKTKNPNTEVEESKM